METGFKGTIWNRGKDEELAAEGFQTTFANGVTVSVQWSETHYCSQRTERTPGKSSTAEVAIFQRDGEWLTRKWRDYGDDVVGWQSPKDVILAMVWAERQPPLS